MTNKKPSPIDPRSEVLKMLERNAEREALVEAVISALRDYIETDCCEKADGANLSWEKTKAIFCGNCEYCNRNDALAALDRFDAGEGK